MAKHQPARHMPKLTKEQVLEMRKRVAPGGDLYGRSPLSVGRAYKVGSGEATKALGGLSAYRDFPQEGKITDHTYLRSSIPNSRMSTNMRKAVLHLEDAPATDMDMDKDGGNMDKADPVIRRLLEADEHDRAVRAAEAAPNGARGNRWSFGDEEPPPSPKLGKRRKVLEEWVSSEDIAAIRAAYLEGQQLDDIAEHFHVSEATVHRVVYGQGRFSDLENLAGKSPRSRGKRRREYLDWLAAHPETPEAEAAAAPVEPEPEAEPRLVRDIDKVANLSDPVGVIRSMLALVPPESLGWVRKPQGRRITEIVAELHAGFTLMQSAIEELQEWARNFEEAQNNGMS